MIFMYTLIVINWPPTLEELFLSTSPNGFNIVLYDFLSVVFYVCFTCINHFISPSPSELADASSWIVFCRDIDRLCVCPSVSLCIVMLRVGVGGWKLYRRVPSRAFPIHLCRHFCCRTYHFVGCIFQPQHAVKYWITNISGSVISIGCHSSCGIFGGSVLNAVWSVFVSTCVSRSLIYSFESIYSTSCCVTFCVVFYLCIVFINDFISTSPNGFIAVLYALLYSFLSVSWALIVTIMVGL